MRSRIAIREYVHPSVDPFVRPSIHPSVTHELTSCKSAIIDKIYYPYERERILCRVSGLVFHLIQYLLEMEKMCIMNLGKYGLTRSTAIPTPHFIMIWIAWRLKYSIVLTQNTVNKYKSCWIYWRGKWKLKLRLTRVTETKQNRQTDHSQRGEGNNE